LKLEQQKLDEIIALVRKRYPNWKGFSDPDFMEDEVSYKQETIAKAREQLRREELQRLLDEGHFDEIVERLDALGKDNNLLWRSVPMKGDLGILYQEDLDKPSFCHTIFDLLHGQGQSHERLRRYAEYVKERGLPNKWTFPTYFLFLTHPDTEMFVKPRTTKWFLQFVGGPKTFASVPTPPTYATIKSLAQQLRDGLQEYGPRDMVDIQGLIWACARVTRGSSSDLVSKEKKVEFIRLFEEFSRDYSSKPVGKEHIRRYSKGRDEAKRNYDSVLVAEELGEDVTDLVLLKLLPYAETEANRERGAWIHVAPATTGDLRKKFEGAGWTDSKDWPRIAEAIFHLVRRCADDPDELPAACAEFSNLPYTKGLQTGMLTPILNALRPDDFTLINNKSRRIVNYLANTSHGQKLAEYPATNETAKELVRELSGAMGAHDLPGVRDSDLLDMFSHWLIAVKKYDFGGTRYWKIAPGAGAWNWEACREGGFMAIGWEELGDLSDLGQAEFDARQEELLSLHDDWTKQGTDQVWKFATIKEGDRIVANLGTQKVLGVGLVTGPYYYTPNVRHGHRVPVEWEDTVSRKIDEGGWRRTLIELTREKYAEISKAPPIENVLAQPFGQVFKDRDEAEWAFGLLTDATRRLGLTGVDDERFSLTLRRNRKNTFLLRLNYGGWVVMSFLGPEAGRWRIALDLLEEKAQTLERFIRGGFSQREEEPRISYYAPPLDVVRDTEGPVLPAFHAALEVIGERFSHWKKTNYRRAHNPDIWAAVVDPARLEKLLDEGIKSEPPEAYFGEEAFNLLEQLALDPTVDFYSSRRNDFKVELLSPFRQLMRDVAAQLHPHIREVMETENRVFSRIPKNDFGRGGAWPFYWGAFYPKGGRRQEEAQLFASINHQRLEFGFSIGEYGNERRLRFRRNCREYQLALTSLLREGLDDTSLYFGEIEDFVGGESLVARTPRSQLSWREWLGDPAADGIRVVVILPADDVISLSKDELMDKALLVFERLFPLVLLAIEDDPLPAIGRYLGVEEPEPPDMNPEYPLSECAEETGFDQELLARWIRAVERKGQAIIYGPPGTGKTYIAERLARHLVGGGYGFVELVQFHPAYAYEDFIQGIRPEATEDGGLDYPVLSGRFLQFCREAESREGKCVLIIDEINRAKLAQVLGELMYLLEYRDREIPLAYGGRFRIPKNVRIIGTMNTADRSIALVDHALRRRFAFLALYPKFDLLLRYHEQNKTGFPVQSLIKTLRNLNAEIGDHHYEVGITFFLHQDLRDQIRDIWSMEIEPYLEEYFFDQPEKVNSFRWEVVGKEILRDGE